MSDRSSRRELFRKSAVTAAGVTAIGGGSSLTLGQAGFGGRAAKSKAVLKLAAREGHAPGATLAEKLDTMEKWGYVGLEVGGGNLTEPGRVQKLKDALKGREIKLSAVCAGFQGCILSVKKEERELAMKTIKPILDATGELESTGMIIVPAFNRATIVPHKQAREEMTGFHRWDERPAERVACILAEIGDYAVKAGTRLLLEPLNRAECYFMRTLADAASMCKELEHPGVAMMGDFWHMTWEETSDCGAFLSAGKYLHHVHMASRRRRKTPGEDGAADNFVGGFRGLKMIGYQDYVSLECGTVGDRNVVVPACAKLLQEQWEQA